MTHKLTISGQLPNLNDYTTEIVAEQVQFLSKAQGESTPKPDASKLNDMDVAGYTQLEEDDVPF